MATKTKAKKPSTGQSGPALKLAIEDLNAKELAVIAALVGIQSRTIAEIAAIAFPRAKEEKANSWTRNSLRRPVCADYVTKLESGTYKLSASGSRRYRNARGRK